MPYSKFLEVECKMENLCQGLIEGVLSGDPGISPGALGQGYSGPRGQTKSRTGVLTEIGEVLSPPSFTAAHLIIALCPFRQAFLLSAS